MHDDRPAEAVSRRIHDRHLLFGFVGETTLNPIDEVVGTSGNGDGALWTGTYLAAEAFHYKVTGHQHASTISTHCCRKTGSASIHQS